VTLRGRSAGCAMLPVYGGRSAGCAMLSVYGGRSAGCAMLSVYGARWHPRQTRSRRRTKRSAAARDAAKAAA
jgi:hypothetical protein